MTELDDWHPSIDGLEYDSMEKKVVEGMEVVFSNGEIFFALSELNGFIIAF